MNTLFDKIWDSHVVTMIEEGPTQLYIDRLYCHEVTSPQAFAGMRVRGLKPLRPERIYCMPDHNTPTHDQDKPIEDPVSRNQVDTLAKNAAEFGLTHYGMMDERNGIIHVVGPERGLTLPGRLSYLYSRCGRCGRFRYRNQRSGNGDGFPVHLAGKTENHAYPCGRQSWKRGDGKGCRPLYHVESDDQRRYRIFHRIWRNGDPQPDDGGTFDFV